MKDGSQLFRKENAAAIDKICLRNFGEKTRKIKLLKGGGFNTTYLIRLVSGRKYVLQFSPVNTQFLMPFEENLLPAEKRICAMLHENGLPANTVVAEDFQASLLDRQYIIFDYIDGVPLSKLPSRHTGSLLRQTGEIIAKMHAINCADEGHFGYASNTFRGVKHETWRDFILFHASEIVEYCQKFDVLPTDLSAKILPLFEKGSCIFDEIKTPYLVHGDLWQGNVLANKKQVLAIIDTDRCLFGDADFDFACPWMIDQNFLEGYGDLPVGNNREIRLLYYKVLQEIVCCCAFKIQYRKNLAFLQRLNIVQKAVENLECC